MKILLENDDLLSDATDPKKNPRQILKFMREFKEDLTLKAAKI